MIPTPDADIVYATLREGGLALVPTDAGYGLLAMGEAAVRRIYALKGRPAAKPCVAVADADIFADVAAPVADDVRAWLGEATRWTPLAVVARLRPGSRLAASMPTEVRAQATHEGTIAAYFSAGPLVEAVARRARADGRLVVGSSANLSGTGNNALFDEVPAAMRDGVDLALDRGPTRFAGEGRLAATLLDLTSGAFLRRGLRFAAIERSWRARGAAAACLPV
jgi:tRNA A37 threonylcarbamoyladenosine synthetase subunit TsaC/SUA5/YrdC